MIYTFVFLVFSGFFGSLTPKEKNLKLTNISSYSSQNPARKKIYTAKLKERRPLNERTFHLVLEAPDISYAPGDVIAIYPENPKDRVDAILKIVKDESLREHLTKEVDLTRVPKGLPEASNLLSSLQKQPLTAEKKLPKLVPLRPRYYSIASSNKTSPGEVELIVVRHGAQTGSDTPGLCSNYLCNQASLGEKLNYFIPKRKKFSLPENPDTPIIMISSGAGVAPFRGFMQERSKTPSKNWLFYGGRTRENDFFYKGEWDKLIDSGHLKLTTAFSRDQKEKIYVQNRMQEHAEELEQWIDDGAIIYICGNSKKMIKDVKASLAEILGGEEKVHALRKSGQLFP